VDLVTLDLGEFRSGAQARSAFVAELGRAFRELGFVRVVGHDVGEALLAAAYRDSGALFALPDATKRRYHLPGAGGARGYTPFGIETAKDQSDPDLKEFWHVGRELAGDHTHDALLPNVWPSEVPSFRPTMLALYSALDRLGGELLQAIAEHLELPSHWFDDKVDRGNSILRPLHYPPLRNAKERGVRSAAHEDINLITLLVGSGEPGLEILTRDGTYLPVHTDAGQIVVNIGDMLQRLTNHVLVSTTHRVVNPPEPQASRSRYSIPFFLHPNPDFSIATLPQCVAADRPDRYPTPITAHAYLVQRLREIGLL
jgi:isopenicillin N synthase-like dioxygenase